VRRTRTRDNRHLASIASTDGSAEAAAVRQIAELEERAVLFGDLVKPSKVQRTGQGARAQVASVTCTYE
jgi:hypothetical protein